MALIEILLIKPIASLFVCDSNHYKHSLHSWNAFIIFPLPSFQMSHCCTEQNYLCHFWHGCYIAKFTASQKKQQQTHTQEKIVTCTFLFCFVCKLSRMEVRLLCFIPLLPGSFFTFPFVLNWLSLNQVHVPECCIESHTA